MHQTTVILVFFENVYFMW